MKRLVFLLLTAKLFSAHEAPYTLSICAIFKNEARYLKEWIEYHRLIGVDHFYLYDNLSSDASRKILLPYVKNKTVTLILWPDVLGPKASETPGYLWPLSTQVAAYENALKWSALRQTKWILFLNIDEFLVPCGEKTIKEILNENDSYPGLSLASEFFDASKTGELPGKKLVIESKTHTSPPPAEKTQFKSVDKTIVKPGLCKESTWPPYRCLFKDGKKPKQISKTELKVNSYQNRLQFPKIDSVKKKWPADGQAIGPERLEELIKSGYNVDSSDQPTEKFIPHLKQKLGEP